MEETNKNKNLALFTHATNVKDIMKWRDEYTIVVITTIMGKNSRQVHGHVSKREYNTEMNFVSLQKTWQHVYNPIFNTRYKWLEHADYTFQMDRLESPQLYTTNYT